MPVHTHTSDHEAIFPAGSFSASCFCVKSHLQVRRLVYHKFDGRQIASGVIPVVAVPVQPQYKTKHDTSLIDSVQ